MLFFIRNTAKQLTLLPLIKYMFNAGANLREKIRKYWFYSNKILQTAMMMFLSMLIIFIILLTMIMIAVVNADFTILDVLFWSELRGH